MLGFTESFIIWLASTIIPTIVGLALIVWLGGLTKPRFIAAFGLGIFLWFFVDTIEGAAGLYKDTGFAGGVDQLSAVILFILGVMFFFWTDRDRNVFNSELAIGQYGIAIPLLVSIAVGIHGLGEGIAFGANVSSGSSTTLLESFGGPNAGIAYVLHKLLEPMMIGACYLVYSNGQAKNTAERFRAIVIFSIAFVFPSLLGAATGYYLGFHTTYFFALATGTSIYAALRLAGPIFTPNSAGSSNDSLRLVLMLMLGFLALYLAALFHS